MKAPQRKHLPHATPLWVRPETAIFFITICCEPRDVNHLAKPEIARGIFESVAFYQTHSKWWTHFMLLMPDHLHAFISFPDGCEMKILIENWKRYLARRLGIDWQRDFFDHRLRHDESYREKEDYVWHNPVRDGLARRKEDWPYVWRPETDNPR